MLDIVEERVVEERRQIMYIVEEGMVEVGALDHPGRPPSPLRHLATMTLDWAGYDSLPQ